MRAVQSGIHIFCLFIVLVCSLFSQLSYSASPVEADEDLNFLSLTPYLEIFRSRDQNLDIHTLADNPLIQFEPISSRQLNLAYSSDKIWLRFRIKNMREHEIPLFIESGFSRLDYVSLHSQNEKGRWLTQRSGDRYPYFQRPFQTQQLLFPVTLPPKSSKTYYLEIQSSSSLHIPLYISGVRSLIESSERRYMADGLFYGICLMAALVGLAALLIFKQAIFLYYFLQVVFITLAIMSLDGSGFALWPDSLDFQEVSVVIFQCLGGIAITLFARAYLHLPRAFPKADLINKGFLIYAALVIAISPFLPYVIISFAINTVESMMIVWIFAQALIRCVQGYKPAYVFITAWTVFFTVILFVVVANLGFTHDYANSIYGLKLAFTLEFIVLLIGLSYRLHLFNKHQNRIRHAAAIARAESKAKSNVLARVSHEIRTPLNGMLGVADLLSESGLNKAQRQHVETIKYSGNALLKILNDILDHSRIGAGKLSLETISYSPKEVSQKVIDVFAPLAQQKDLEFLYFYDDRIPEQLLGDPARVRQVMINLLSNAIKFTQTGTIQLRVKLFQDDILFEIEDTGSGVDQNLEARLFDSYSQGDQTENTENTGSGLGLSISKQLVKLMQGKIGYRALQTGSLFWFSLPVITEEY